MNSTTITLETKIKRSDNIVSNTIQDEKVMMSLNKGNYYSINSIGSRIWEIIEEEKTVNEVCNQLLEEYEIDKPHCENAVITFLNKLNNEELLIIS